MKRPLLAIWLLTSCIRLPAQDQEQPPVIEWIGGYSGLLSRRTGTGPAGNPGPPAHEFSNGAVFSFNLNANRHLRIVLGEIAWQQHGSGLNLSSVPALDVLSLPSSEAHFNTYQLLFGVEYVRRSARYSVFVRGLGGLAARHLATPSGIPGSPTSILVNDNGPALAVGGGLEHRFSRNWGYRIVQFDYIPAHMHRVPLLIGNPALEELPSWQHNWRFQTGVAFAFGRRGR